MLPALVRNWFDDQLPGTPRYEDVSALLGDMRMIKSPEEIEVMKQAGEIAGAMMGAAEGALAEGAAEYEAALAVIDAGTRRAADFLTAKGWEAFISPMIHNLQIMQSGRDTSMVHRRASVKTLEAGDPVYFCFLQHGAVQAIQARLRPHVFHQGSVRRGRRRCSRPPSMRNRPRSPRCAPA